MFGGMGANREVGIDEQIRQLYELMQAVKGEGENNGGEGEGEGAAEEGSPNGEEKK